MRILAIHPTKIFLNNSKWIESNIKSHCWSLCPNWRIDYLNIWLTIMRVLSLVIIVKHIPKKNVGISRLKDDESNKSRKKCKEEKKKRTCQSWESESSSNRHYIICPKICLGLFIWSTNRLKKNYQKKIKNCVKVVIHLVVSAVSHMKWRRAMHELYEKINQLKACQNVSYHLSLLLLHTHTITSTVWRNR